MVDRVGDRQARGTNSYAREWEILAAGPACTPNHADDSQEQSNRGQDWPERIPPENDRTEEAESD